MTVLRIALTGERHALAEARRIIERGGVVAVPTETFYGLAVRYDDVRALGKLFGMKHRPETKAMPLIAGGEDKLRLVALPLPPAAEDLAQRFWPGPLTMLTKAAAGLSRFLTGGTGNVAVRIPGESFALRLARLLDAPVTATSANISGYPPAAAPEKVIEYFGEGLDLIVDGGRTPGGRPSTIVDVTGEEIRIVREGAISSGEIFTVSGRRPFSAPHGRPQ